MALFNFRKKKEEKKATPCCTETNAEKTLTCCRGSIPKEDASCCCGKPVGGIRCIKVLGTGCKSCHDQYEYAKKAVNNLGLDIEVEYITDMEAVMEYGVISMPAIVVNDKVLAFGKVLKAAKLEELIKDLIL